ncbi:MAG: hypothetical protein J2P17_33710, partial [Mycobacterium sp.]|nr:hypothetical protein [Mycobacterium sp.]
SVSGADGGNPYRYAGTADEGNGLSYNRYRYYNPGSGRFTAPDPLGIGSGDANPYIYVFNQPTASADPMGTKPQGSGDCGQPNSFTPGTKVLMADGTTKPIERVKPGDKVMAVDPATGKATPQKVDATITGNGDKDLVDIRIVQADGTTATVTATAGHPFWVDTDGRPDTPGGQWINATQLRHGQWLKTADGNLVQVAGTAARTQHTHAHNVTVDSAHTYYVLAGNTPILVHNCGEGPLRPGVADTRPAVGGGPSRAYQVAHTGNCEQLCVGGGSQVWADGVEGIDTLLDAKYVGNPGRSPFVPGSAIPDKIRGFINAQVESEFSRYADVIADTTNPFERLRVITNEQDAVPYFEGLLSKFGIPGEVVVR